MMTKEYIASGRIFRPGKGKKYENLNGSIYRCLDLPIYNNGVALMQSCSSPDGVQAWTFTAVGIRMYEDGRIDWEHSLNGRWEDRV